MFVKAVKVTLGVGVGSLLLLGGLVVIVASLSGSSTATNRPTTAPLPLVTSTPPQAEGSRSYVLVKSFEGSGIKDTEDFTVGEQWRVSWDVPAESAIFQIYIYKGTQPVNVAANVQGASRDSSFQRGAGTYHLKISGFSKWKVTVEDLR